MPTQLSVVNDYPEDFQAEYAHKRFALIDPTLIHRQASSKPLVWSESLYTPENKHLWETAKSYGIGHGFSIPIHDAVGNVACLFSAARDKEFDAKELREILPLAKIMAACAHTVASLRITPTLVTQDLPKLTAREKEILQYLSIGKTTWDISTIVSISEAAVLFHIKNLVRKMDASNRTHAAVKAMAYGLIN
jgi:DNA-binding CsgD family transcriptional regulator